MKVSLDECLKGSEVAPGLKDVAFPFVFERQGSRAVHPVEKDDAVEVVEFVLHDPGVKAVCRQRHRIAFDISGANLDAAVAGYDPSETGNRETALPPVFNRFTDRLNLWVGQKLRGDFRMVVAAWHPIDEQAQVLGNLRRRETNTIFREHRSNHVSGKIVQSLRPETIFRNRFGHLSEHRVAQPDDLKRRGLFEAVGHWKARIYRQFSLRGAKDVVRCVVIPDRASEAYLTVR